MHKRPWMDFVINPAFSYAFSQEEQKKNNLHKNMIWYDMSLEANVLYEAFYKAN